MVASRSLSAAAHQQAPTASIAAEIADTRVLHDKGEYGAAVARAQALLDRVQQQPAAPALDVASALDVLVESLFRAESSRADRLLELARRAVEIKEQTVGADDPNTAYSLTNLGVVLMRQADFDAARGTLERALAVQERALGSEHELTARTLAALGNVFRLTGDLKTARSYLERSLRVMEGALGPRDMQVAYGLISLSSVLAGSGDRRTAMAMSERAADVVRGLHGPDHPVLAQILGNLAYDLDRLGAFEKSEALHRQSVEMFERTTGPESLALAWELNNYGLLDWRLGDFAASLPKFERALSIWTRLESADASKALNNLAISHRRLGDLAAARRYYERSLQIKERTYGPDHAEVALVLFNTANLLKEMGDLSAARPLYERALRIREQKFGASDSLTAYAMNGLGEALLRQQQYAAAEPLLERAVAIWRDLKVPELAIGLSSLAELARERGSPGAALKYYDEARLVYTQAFSPDHIDVAVLWNNAASVLAELADWDGARIRYTRALAIIESQLATDHPSIAEIASGLAASYFHLGDFPRALDLALRSERISRMQFKLTSLSLSEREALLFSARRAPALDVLLTLAVDGRLLPDQLKDVADAVIRSRAMVLDEVGQRNRLRGADPAIATRVADLKHARQRLANLIVRGTGTKDHSFQRLLERARLDTDTAERRLAEAGLEFRERFERSQAGVMEVAAHIPADAALLAYVAYDHLVPARRSASTRQSNSEPRYAALVLRAGRPDVSVVPLGSMVRVDGLISGWRREMVRAAKSPGGSGSRRVSGGVSSAVWTPVASALQGSERVFVVPDGALNLVSFAALPAGPDAFLIESGPLIHYLSAERDLIAQAVDRPSNRGLLAVGNPAYGDTLALRAGSQEPSQAREAVFRGASASCPDFRRVRFEPLSATLDEVADVAATWRAHDTSEVQRLTGTSATEAAFKSAAPRRRIVHLATHGFFLGSCGDGGTRARGIGGLATMSHKRTARPTGVDNPLMLSGVALAGANQRAAAGPGDEDGILTAEEVASLQLDGVEWAVLSACDTGLGEVRAGEGVFGLRRAFAAAGVRTTIMSLWEVEDTSTRFWMAALYESRLNRGLSTAEAVREAGRAVLRDRRARKLSTHPFYWAAFVASGDWR